ncbi:MAG: hypothetical protein U9N34_04225 [Candidatus Cloacimonadota bacterium]|nr:hypothetical protein [Candidatus Cloacimonadota bacterium]
MFRNFFLLLIIVLPNLLLSQTLPSSAMQAAGSNMIFLYDEPANTFLNSATNLEGLQSSFSNFYQIKDLNQYSVIINKNLGRYGVSAGLRSLYFSAFSKNSLTLSCSYHSEFIQLGISENINYTNIEDYQNEYKYITDLGLLITHKQLYTGVSYKNIFGFEDDNERTPIILNWENGYHINENVRVGIMIEKEHNFNFTSAFGSSYCYRNLFTISTSYQLNPDRFSAGIAFKIKNYEISYAIKSHQYLNLSHFVSVKLL